MDIKQHIDVACWFCSHGCLQENYNIILYILFSLIYLHICTANVKHWDTDSYRYADGMQIGADDDVLFVNADNGVFRIKKETNVDNAHNFATNKN